MIFRSFFHYTKSVISLFLLFYFLFFILTSPFPVFSQMPEFGIATTYPIEEEVEDGDIVSLSLEKDVLIKSVKEYDDRMFGVVTLNPQVVFKQAAGGTPVVRQGDVLVNVTTLNGPIKSGDYVTSSEIAGKGQKGTEVTGYLLGTAVSDFDGTNGQEITYNSKTISLGKVKVAIGIGPASAVIIKSSGGLLGSLHIAAFSLVSTIQQSKQAEKVIRYVLAASVAIITITVNFHTFGRNITKGIESIGRNPLAKASIQSMIVLNIIMITIVSVSGIILSLVIISM